ncbi:MAG: 30S ribosomal protein S20 [Gammaproteobacteria bacterium]
MANTKQAEKRARQSEAARLHNISLRSRMRTAIKKVRQAIESGDISAAKQAFQITVPVIDRLVNKRIVAKNAAARYKSRLNTQIKRLSA